MFSLLYQIQNLIFMDVITVESDAFKELMAKINMIAHFVSSQELNAETNIDEEWVDGYEVRTYLNISVRTLQRLRSERLVNYTTIRGRIYYKISEIKRLMNERLIRCDRELLTDLIHNHNNQHAKQRRNLRKNQ